MPPSGLHHRSLDLDWAYFVAIDQMEVPPAIYHYSSRGKAGSHLEFWESASREVQENGIELIRIHDLQHVHPLMDST